MFDKYFSNTGIKKVDYYYSHNNSQLFDIKKLNKPLFNLDGSNLTISLLSLNRVKLTIKLLSSIEYYFSGFRGDILIVDNGSSADQLAQLKEFVGTFPLNVTIKELSENHGVGRARNIAAKEIQTDWIMFIDNDMYFVKNPLSYIKQTIEALGCNFLNLPLINYDNITPFALGGALFPYVWNEGAFIGAGSCFDFKRGVEIEAIQLQTPFLSDFLFGGASIVNRHAFNSLEGFDYDMFVGFEDIDFSLRLYNKGFKIGNIPAFTLVHNHKPSENKDDLRAEKERFNSGVIKSSADAFLKKNGIPVYDESTEEWLKMREKELNIISEQKTPSQKENGNTKPKIALIADIENWAFHNISNNIVKHLSHKYDFEIYFHADYAYEKWLDLYPELYAKKPDIILVFWRPILKHFFSPDLRNYLEYKFQISQNDFEAFVNQTVILTGVYDHLFLSEKEIEDYKQIYTNDADGYFVASNLLKGIYEKIDAYPNPYTVIQDGVDATSFYKRKDKRFSKPNEPLVVGWAGNSKWRWDDDGVDHKGFLTIIKPAVEELSKEGYLIELKYADKVEPETHISPGEMPDFYHKLDVYICTSDIEGTPNPVLESMACGLGVISTDVGIVQEVFGKAQRDFILTERTKEALKEKLKAILKDRSLLEKLSTENQIRMAHWTWESKCEKFDEMFDYYLFKNHTKKAKRKNFPFLQPEVTEEVIEEETKLVEETFIVQSDAPQEANQLAMIQQEYEQLTLQTNDLKNGLDYYKKSYNEVKEWYHKEYEGLPLWYKRFGHIIKVLKGNRSLGSIIKTKASSK